MKKPGHVLVLVINTQLTKAGYLRILEHPRAAYVIISLRRLVIAWRSLSTQSGFKEECTNGLDSASWLLGVSSGVFLACSVFFHMTSAVTGGSIALVSLQCLKWQPPNKFSLFHLIILVGVVDLFVLALFFGKEDTFWSSKLMRLTSYDDLSFF